MYSYNTPENLALCKSIVDQASQLLYYSHIPTAVIALLIGFFVLYKSRANLLSRILFAITFLFASWSTFDLMVWIHYDKSSLVMFLWSFFGIIHILIYVLSLYFIAVFIEGKNVPLYKKLVFAVPILPVLLLAPTSYNLTGFNISDCASLEGSWYTNYYLFLSFFIALFIILFAVYKFKTVDASIKKPMVYLVIGIELFLIIFFSTVFGIAYLVDNGYISNGNYSLEQYGLFSMPIFVAFLAYVIVRFRVFNIKLIATQALVLSLMVLIGSQFFFIKVPINFVLNSFTFAAIIIFGYFLIKSVKREIEQRKEIEGMAEDVKRAYVIEKRAKEEIEKLDKVKDQFLTITQHNLRTPLTSIMGYSDLILNGTYGKQNKKTTEVIKKFQMLGKGMIKMVNDFLDMAQFQLGKEVVMLKPGIDAVLLLQEIVGELEFKAKSKGIFLTLEKPDRIFLINADREKLKAALFNVVDNAVKYTVKGGVTIQVKNHDSVKIIVADTGIGILQEKIKDLFNSMFERGDQAKKVSTIGSGVGLYLSSQIIKSHKGKIWVESNGENKGSIFHIELPVG